MRNLLHITRDLQLGQVRAWYETDELNLLLAAHEPVRELYWWAGNEPPWTQLESIEQLADVLALASGPGQMYQIEDDAPVTCYAQGQRLNDGNLSLELAIIAEGRSYNMRLGRGVRADRLSSAPDQDVIGDQSLTTAEVYELLAGWASGHGLPPGYGGSIHVY